MLSIASMKPGSVNYYTDLAREDYYLKGGEPPGLWLGTCAAALGLEGKVLKDEFQNLFRGFAPDGSESLVRNARSERSSGESSHHPGWDLTFSAPKSVSVFWSQVDEDVRSLIQEAQLRAVKDALDYLEDVAAITKRGHGGVSRESTKGFVAATFEHGTSRAQDPQLHTHALVLNLSQRFDETWGTLLGRPAFIEKMAAGAIYRATLAFELQKNLGLDIDRTSKGFEIRGIPDSVMRKFSSRRIEIEERLEAMGKSDAKSAAEAAKNTRSRKKDTPRSELFSVWKETGISLGLKVPKVRAGKNPEPDLAKIQEAVLSRVMKSNLVFTERDFVQRFAQEAVGGFMSGSQAIEQARNCLDSSQNLQCLGWFEGTRVYTWLLSKEMRAALERTKSFLNRGAKKVSDRQLDQALRVMGLDGNLTAEQREVLESVVQKRGALRTVEGIDDLERLRVLQAARIAWERKGYRVYAVSPASADAKELHSWSNITTYSPSRLSKLALEKKSHKDTLFVMRNLAKRGVHFKPSLYSINSFLRFATKVKQKPWITFDKKTVLIIDSPERMSSKELEPLLKAIRKTRGTIVVSTSQKTQELTAFEKQLKHERSRERVKEHNR